MKYTKEQLKQMIDLVNDEGVGLTPWELGFMESITEWFDKNGWLSVGQIEKLDTIYSNKTK